MSFNAESTHPYIMNSRIKATSGTGGIGNIPIASAETLGGIKIGGSANPITITGSGNASVRKATSELLGVVKAGDGVSIDAEGAISGIAYSTTEHKTGRKWIDGKDIYEKTIHASDVTLTATEVIDATIKSNTVDTLIAIIGTVLDNEGSLYECYVSSTDRVVPVVNTNGVTLLISNVTVKGYDITVQYTKLTTP